MKKLLLILAAIALVACATKNVPPVPLTDEEILAKDMWVAAHHVCWENTEADRILGGRNISADYCNCFADKLIENPTNHALLLNPKENEAAVRALVEGAAKHCDPIDFYSTKLSGAQLPHYEAMVDGCMSGTVLSFLNMTFSVAPYCACYSYNFIKSLPSIDYLTNPKPEHEKQIDKIGDESRTLCKDL